MADCSWCAYDKVGCENCLVFPPQPRPQKGDCGMFIFKQCQLCGQRGACPLEKKENYFCCDRNFFFLSPLYSYTAARVH